MLHHAGFENICIIMSSCYTFVHHHFLYYSYIVLMVLIEGTHSLKRLLQPIVTMAEVIGHIHKVQSRTNRIVHHLLSCSLVCFTVTVVVILALVHCTCIGIHDIVQRFVLLNPLHNNYIGAVHIQVYIVL